MWLPSVVTAFALLACAQGAAVVPAANVSSVTSEDFELPSNYHSKCGTHTTENPERFDVSACKGVKVGESCEVKVCCIYILSFVYQMKCSFFCCEALPSYGN